MTEMPTRPLARIIKAQEAECWIDGYAFLERAKDEAAAIRAGAQDEVARAREAGREEGRKAGEAQAAALLMRSQADVERYLGSVEPMVAMLAMQIVKRVIGRFDDAELVARAAHEARATSSASSNLPMTQSLWHAPHARRVPQALRHRQVR